MSNTGYIVRFKEGTPDDVVSKAKEDIKAAGGSVGHEYSLFPGFSAKLPDFHVNTLKGHPHIDGLEEDKEVSIN